MPVRLTSREFRIIIICVAVAAISLIIGVKYFGRAFPEAAIDFRVTRTDSTPIAENFLRGQGADLAGYRHASRFSYDDDTKVYLERTVGLERMEQLTRGPIHLWRWSHRWFKPQQKEEYRVDVSPAGQVVGYDHEILEDAPGANLDEAAARTIAENFLTGVMKRDLGSLEFVETQSKTRKARTDYSFTWKQKDVNLGDGSLRVEVDVAGDKVSSYSEFVKIPEQWTRDYQQLRSRNISAQLVAEFFFILLTVAMVIILVMRLRDRDVPIRLAVGFALTAAVLLFLGQLNDFSLAEFGYRTTDTYSSFVTSYLFEALLSALGVGVYIFFLVAGSEPVYREDCPGLISLRKYFSWQGLRSRSFFMANVVGIGLTFFFFAYQTVFYLTANKLGAWAPADVNYSDLLNTRLPWVWVLFMGFFPAVSEELQFRAFAIPFLRKLTRSGTLAVVLAAFMWSFLHSAYPNQPFFIRGLEVGLGGLLIGVIMLRFGVLATLVWHYSVDALYTAFLLIRSHNHYLMLSGAITAGIMLVPLILALIAYWRSGTFSEEESLTNASAGVSRAPREAAPVETEVSIAYQPLSTRRLVLGGILVAAFLAAALLPAHEFGKGIKLRATRKDALTAADTYLREHHVDPSQYHTVAWIQPNVDPEAVKYLMEHESLAATDKTYRQATHLLLWSVRYFRPLQKEEYFIYIDAQTGKVFDVRHLLDENAPGASLSPDQAKALGEKALGDVGYQASEFDLQSSTADKKKAREDYTLIWQAKPGDPLNVADARYRLEVDIAGDQVVGFTRMFKLPEKWERAQSTTSLENIALTVVSVLFLALLLGGGLLIFVKQVRAGKILWRPAAKVGVVIFMIMLAAEVNVVPTLDRSYETSMPLASFHLILLVGILVAPLGAGLLTWLLVGLATSLYPDAWQIFSPSARGKWRRDAAIAIIVTLVAGAGLDRLGQFIANRFPAYAGIDTGLVSGGFDAYSPGLAFFLAGVRSCVIYAAVAAVIIYIVRLGVTRRTWWAGAGALLLLPSLGSANAHSVPAFLVEWVFRFVSLAVIIGIVALFFRDNFLAYLAAAFCSSVVDPLISLFSEPARFYQWNGLLLVALAAITLGWMFASRAGATSATPSP